MCTAGWPIRCQVRNLDKDWQNGCAFLALFNGAVPGQVDMAAVDPAQARNNIARGIELFKAWPCSMAERLILLAEPVECARLRCSRASYAIYSLRPQEGYVHMGK